MNLPLGKELALTALKNDFERLLIIRVLQFLLLHCSSFKILLLVALKLMGPLPQRLLGNPVTLLEHSLCIHCKWLHTT